MILKEKEFIQKYCNRCINRKNKNDLCCITTDIRGKLKCANFEERGKKHE